MKKIKSILLLVKSLFKKRRRMVKVKLCRFSDAELLRYSQNVMHRLAAHAADFPSPPPLPDAVLEMEAAMTAWKTKALYPLSFMPYQSQETSCYSNCAR